jgi:hypothetical protein
MQIKWFTSAAIISTNVASHINILIQILIIISTSLSKIKFSNFYFLLFIIYLDNF